MDYLWLIPLLGGGTVGAILTIIYNYYQNKKQSIKYELNANTIFHPGDELDETVCLNIYGNEQGELGSSHSYYNLSLVILKLKNISNRDFEKFSFGVNIDGGQEIIKIESVTKDRKHIVEFDKEINFGHASNEIDIILNPFNRDEVYNLKFFIATIYSSENEGLIEFEESDFKLSSSVPIDFVKVETGNSKQSWKQYILHQIPMIILILIAFAYTNKNFTKEYEEKMERIKSHEEMHTAQIDSIEKINHEISIKLDSVNALKSK